MATPNDLRAGRALAKADRVCEIARVDVQAIDTATGAYVAPRSVLPAEQSAGPDRMLGGRSRLGWWYA